MDEENELKASFQKLSKNFFYLIGQREYLSIKVGKKVSKGAFSVIQLIFADSRISLCHCHQTCLTTTTMYYYLFSTDQRFLAMTVPEEVGDDCPFGK